MTYIEKKVRFICEKHNYLESVKKKIIHLSNIIGKSLKKVPKLQL